MKPLFAALKLEISGVPPRDRLAALLVGGLELRRIKTEKGYVGVGAWWYHRHDGPRPQWKNFCQDTFGITDDTELNLWKGVMAVKARLALADGEEAREILEMMENAKPSELTDGTRKRLVAGIRRHGLKDGDTQQSLIRELSEPDIFRTIPELFWKTRSDTDACARALGPPAPGEKPADRFRDLFCLNMTIGLTFKAAREVALTRMPDDMLSEKDLAWKRRRETAARKYLEEEPEAPEQPTQPTDA